MDVCKVDEEICEFESVCDEIAYEQYSEKPCNGMVLMLSKDKFFAWDAINDIKEIIKYSKLFAHKFFLIVKFDNSTPSL